MRATDQPQTFEAPSMAEAFAEVKRQLGSEAVILSTRVVERRGWLGLRRREVFQITAGRNINTPRHSPRSIPPAARGRLPVYAQVAPESKPSAAAVLATPAAGAAAVLSLTREIDQVKAMVKDLVTHVRSKNSPQVPEDLFEYYLKLVEQHVAAELAEQIVRTVQRSHRPELLADRRFVTERIAEQIEQLIPSAGAIKRTKSSGPHVVALVGPTGVGKTTTIAKIAADLKLRQRRKVGLITLDTYRIAAVEQLRRYAEIIGSPLSVVSTPEEMPRVLESMRDFDFVLIDTAGRSPNDVLKLGELRGFLEKAAPDEVHLVLSSTCGQSSMELAAQRFAETRIDRVIFTKLDEASELGVILNVIRKLNKSVSYITTGQDVPDDIEVAAGRTLASMILGSRS